MPRPSKAGIHIKKDSTLWICPLTSLYHLYVYFMYWGTYFQYIIRQPRLPKWSSHAPNEWTNCMVRPPCRWSFERSSNQSGMWSVPWVLSWTHDWDKVVLLGNMCTRISMITVTRYMGLLHYAKCSPKLVEVVLSNFYVLLKCKSFHLHAIVARVITITLNMRFVKLKGLKLLKSYFFVF